MKVILSGNQAIARDAFEEVCPAAWACPGTPATEILVTTLSYKEINSSWAAGEKLAPEVNKKAFLIGREL